MTGRRWACVVALTALVAAGCWEQPGFDSGGSNTSWLPVGVDVGNVGSLHRVFSAPASGVSSGTHAVISSGHLFVTGERLASYDASGATGCTGPTPQACTPQWVSADATTFSEPIVVGGGRVWGVTTAGIVGYDVAGQQGCGGVPRQCSPVVTIPVTGTASALRWVADALHVTVATGPLHSWTITHRAYGADGSERWRAAVAGPSFVPYGSVTVGAGDLVYVSEIGNGVAAFDAAGVIGCSGVPKVCVPRWRYDAVGAPIVTGGRLYASSATGRTSAFDAAGTQGCSGVPVVCGPLWSTAAAGASPAVTSDHLYLVEGDHVAVYSLGGAGCSGAPLTCTPLWTDAPTGAPYAVWSLSAAGGVVYSTTFECPGGNCSGVPVVRVEAHDATGQLGCTGSPKVCTPRWSSTIPFQADPAMVVGDTVYVVGVYTLTLGGTAPAVWAYRPGVA